MLRASDFAKGGWGIFFPDSKRVQKQIIFFKKSDFETRTVRPQKNAYKNMSEDRHSKNNVVEKTYVDALTNAACNPNEKVAARSKGEKKRSKKDEDDDDVDDKIVRDRADPSNKKIVEVDLDDDPEEEKSQTSLLITLASSFYNTFSSWNERVIFALEDIVLSKSRNVDMIELELYGANTLLILKQGVPFLLSLIDNYEKENKDGETTIHSNRRDGAEKTDVVFLFDDLHFATKANGVKPRGISLKDFTTMLGHDINVWVSYLGRFLSVCSNMKNRSDGSNTKSSTMSFDFESMIASQTVSNSIALIKRVLLELQTPVNECDSKSFEEDKSQHRAENGKKIMRELLVFIERSKSGKTAGASETEIKEETLTSVVESSKKRKKTKRNKPQKEATPTPTPKPTSDAVILNEDVIDVTAKVEKIRDPVVVVAQKRSTKPPAASLNNGDVFSVVSKYLPGKRQHKCWVFEFKDYGIFEGPQPWKSFQAVDAMIDMESDFEMIREEAHVSLYNLKTYASFWNQCRRNLYCSVKLLSQKTDVANNDSNKTVSKLNLPSFFWLQFFMCLNTHGHTEDGVHKKSLPSFSLGDLDSEKEGGANLRTKKIRHFYDTHYLTGRHLEKKLYAFSFNRDLVSVAKSFAGFVRENPNFFEPFEFDDQILSTEDFLKFSNIVSELSEMDASYEEKWIRFIKDYAK